MRKLLLLILSFIVAVLSGCQFFQPNYADQDQGQDDGTTDVTPGGDDQTQDEVTIEQVADKVKEGLPTEISENLTVSAPSEYPEAVVSYTSANETVLSNAGVYTRPVNDTKVVLTFTVSYKEQTTTFTHEVTVKGIPTSDKLAELKEELTLDVTSVKADLTLPIVDKYDATVEWSCSVSDFAEVSEDKLVVTRPNETFSDESVTLTATIKIGSQSVKKEFALTVLALKVTEISVSQLPSNVTVALNATEMDVTGGKLALVLDDSSTKTIDLTSDMIVELSASTIGEGVASVSYLGCDTEFEIIVYKPSSAITLAVGESRTADFENALDLGLAVDNAQTPNSALITDGAIDGNSSLYIESEGGFKTLFIKDFVELKAGETYVISFSYKVVSMVDTIYFQLADTGKYTQFGNPNELNVTKTFEWIYSASVDANLIQIFPGAQAGKTALVIDNLTIERIVAEENVHKTTLDNVGDYVLETFGDPNNSVITLDTAPAPGSSVVIRGINGSSLSLVSNGNYSGVYLKPNAGLLQAGGHYKVSFDYVLSALGDTIYFQWYNRGAASFTQFGTAEQIGTEVHHFEYEIEVTDNACIFHIFPGSTLAQTSLLIDNVKIEKLETPVKTYSVTYVTNGHGVQPENLVEQMNLPTELPELTEEGYTFGGWYTNAALTIEAVAGAELTADATLYAKWIADELPPVVEENVYRDSLDNAGDYVLETFGDPSHTVITVDSAPAPDSSVVAAGIEGSSLLLVSNGGYNGVYLKPTAGLLKVGDTYIISFDYNVSVLGDTLYFKWYNAVPGDKQFADPNRLGETLHFEVEITITDASCIFQIFPGSTAAETKVLIDNFKIEKKLVETNISKDSLDNVGDYVLETFGDSANVVITLDNAGAPNSSVVAEGIEGSSYALTSNGSYGGVYFKPNAGLLKAGNTYIVSFDYKVTEFADTLYFQWYNHGAASFTQFGSPETVGMLQHFEYEIVVTDDACIMHIFPGGANAVTSLLIDNFKIELVA